MEPELSMAQVPFYANVDRLQEVRSLTSWDMGADG